VGAVERHVKEVFDLPAGRECAPLGIRKAGSRVAKVWEGDDFAGYRINDAGRAEARAVSRAPVRRGFRQRPLDEFYRVAFRKKIYRTIDELQTDLDAWITEYNDHRPHQGRWCFGKTPMQTFLDALPLAKEKLMAA
jgi:hypothetical protein